MAQLSDPTKIASVADKALSGFLSTLKTGGETGAAGNSLFASLLAQTEASLPKIEAKEPSFARTDREAGSFKAARDRAEQEPQEEALVARRETDAAPCKKAAERHDVRAETEGREQEQTEVRDIREEDVSSAGGREQEEAAVEAEEEAQSVAVSTEEESVTQEDEAEEENGAEDLAGLLAALCPLVDRAVVARQGEGNNNEEPETIEGSHLTALMNAQAAIQEQIDGLKAMPEEGATKADGTGGVNKKKVEALTEALADIAQEIAEMKDDLAGEGLVSSETSLGDSLKEKAQDAVESLWQKMVQETKKASLGAGAQSGQQGENPFSDMMRGNAAFHAAPEAVVHAAAPSAVQSFASIVSQNAAEAVDGVGNASTAGNTSATQNLSGLEGVRPAGSYDFASQLSAARVTKGGAAGLPQPVEQVVVQLHKAVKEGQSEMTIQLRPAEMGKIEIKLTFGADKSVTGVVTADNQGTLTLLQKDSDALQRALQEAGLQADAGCMEFCLRDNGQSSSFARQQNEQTWNELSSAAAASGTETMDSAESMAGADLYYVTPGRVNLRV